MTAAARTLAFAKHIDHEGLGREKKGMRVTEFKCSKLNPNPKNGTATPVGKRHLGRSRCLGDDVVVRASCERKLVRKLRGLQTIPCQLKAGLMIHRQLVAVILHSTCRALLDSTQSAVWCGRHEYASLFVL